MNELESDLKARSVRRSILRDTSILASVRTLAVFIAENGGRVDASA